MNNLNLFDFNGLIIVDDTNRDIDEKISIELSRLYNKKIIKITSNDKEFTILK